MAWYHSSAMRPELLLPATARRIEVENDATVLRRKIRLAAAVVFLGIAGLAWKCALYRDWVTLTRWGYFGIIGEYQAPYKKPTANYWEQRAARATLDGRDFVPTAIIWQGKWTNLKSSEATMLRCGIGVLIATLCTPCVMAFVVVAARRRESVAA